MNFLLYLLTANSNFCNCPFRQYPHENDVFECELINKVYWDIIGEIRKMNFETIYWNFLGSVNSQSEESDAKRVEVSNERKSRSEEMTENEFEELKKRLAQNCPKRRYAIDVVLIKEIVDCCMDGRKKVMDLGIPIHYWVSIGQTRRKWFYT